MVSGDNSSQSSTPEDVLCEVDSEKNVGLAAAMVGEWAQVRNNSFAKGCSETDVFENSAGHVYTRGVEIHQVNSPYCGASQSLLIESRARLRSEMIPGMITKELLICRLP